MSQFTVPFDCPRCEEPLDVEMSFTPAERQTFDYPGCPESIEVESDECVSCGYTFTPTDVDAIIEVAKDRRDDQ